MRRPPILGVVGGGGGAAPPGSETYELAVAVGRAAASRGALVLCGGRGGVMEGAAKGAREAGGHTLGILPTLESEGGANPYIDCAVYTGLGDGRNYVNVRTSDAVIALAGEAGTLSEIALALKTGIPVVYLSAWDFLHAQPAFAADWTASPEEAVEIALRRADAWPGEPFDRPLRYPDLPEQGSRRRKVEEFLTTQRSD
jgi:uncharacterized protein (TIGR00725 family)